MIKGVAVVASRAPEINFSLSKGILAIKRLELGAMTTNTAIEIAAPARALLMSIKARAARSCVLY
jgi:hypothetical protein